MSIYLKESTIEACNLIDSPKDMGDIINKLRKIEEEVKKGGVKMISVYDRIINKRDIRVEKLFRRLKKAVYLKIQNCIESGTLEFDLSDYEIYCINFTTKELRRVSTMLIETFKLENNSTYQAFEYIITKDTILPEEEK